MTRTQLAAGTLVALAAGALTGWLARPSSAVRPAAVEAVLAAHERGDAAATRRALDGVGPTESLDSPWREEVRFVRGAVASDWDDLRRLGHDGPPVAGAARALALLADRDPDLAERRRAAEALRVRFPRSWVHGATPAGAR